MNSFEFNKMAGAVLGTLLFVMGLGLFSNGLFARVAPAKPGYDLPAVAESEAGGAPTAAPTVPLPELLAKADPKKGESLAKVCTTCHSFSGPPKATGPHLDGVVGRKVASTEFAYSDAMKAHGGDWTYEALDKFIANPKGTVPGTKMGYGGEKDPGKRADIIDYLKSLSPNAPPFPTAQQ